jgi:hypothetical protein
VRALELLHVDLLHVKHCFHDTGPFFRVLVLEQLGQDGGDDLPEEVEAILEPAALDFPAAAREQLVPILVNFLLAVAAGCPWGGRRRW